MSLNYRFIDSAVSFIGIDTKGKKCTGTGFLFIGPGFKEDEFKCFVVTNKHLLKNLKKAEIQFNYKNVRSKLVTELNCDELNCFCHPNENIDIGIFLVRLDIIENPSFLNYKSHILNIESLKSKKISEGDSIYLIGYPTNRTYDTDYALVRNGIISQIHPLYDGKSKDFIIDCHVFPGNSGSPVIFEDPNDGKSKLIGILHEYHSIEEKKGTTHSGLGSVYPIDYVLKTIKEYYNFIKQEFQESTEILSQLALKDGDVIKWAESEVDHDTQIFLDKLQKKASDKSVDMARKYYEEKRDDLIQDALKDLFKLLSKLKNLLNSDFFEIVMEKKVIKTSTELIDMYISRLNSMDIP